jgi:putative transposase
MPNTYTQLFIQFVFAVKYRRALIHPEWKTSLHKYITAIIQENGHKMLQINSVEDHIHIFVGVKPHQSMSSLIQIVKTQSSKWINEQNFCKQKFLWQEGFGAFSYSMSHISNVVRYIQNQEVHHQKERFLDEYCRFLNEYDISWDERYIFKEPS